LVGCWYMQTSAYACFATTAWCPSEGWAAAATHLSERRRAPAQAGQGAAGRTRTSKPWGSETHPERTHRTGRTRSGCSPKPGPRRCALSGAPPVSARIALTDTCCLLALLRSRNQKSQAGQGVDLLAFSSFRSPSCYLLALLRNRSQARKTRKAKQVKGLTCSRCATPQPQSSWRFAHSASTWKHHQTLRRSLLCSPGMCKPRRCHGAAAMRRRKMTDSGRAGEAETGPHRGRRSRSDGRKKKAARGQTGAAP